MAETIGRLIATFEADISKFEAGRKQVESGMKETARSVTKSQKEMTDAEVKAEQERRLAIYKQRQSLNALVTEYKKAQKEMTDAEVKAERERRLAIYKQRQSLNALVTEYKKAERGTKTFSQHLSELSTSVAALQGPLGGISGRLSSLSSLFAGITGPAGAVALGIGAVATAAIGAASAIYSLSKSTAEATGHFKDLAQQTGFSVETLSALANVAETSGGNIDTVTASLGIFQKNMVEAQDSTTELSRLFKQLNIDTQDNEKALRQALAELRKLPEGAQQTALALKLFGRSGREVLAISKELPGTLDDAIKSMRGVSLTTTDMANKGDELADAIARMTQVFGHATNVIGQEFGPDVKDAVEKVTKVIIDNKDVIREWATAFADAARGALIVAEAVKTLGGVITGLGNLPIPAILRILGSVSGATGILSGLQSLGAASPGVNTQDLVGPMLGRPAYRTPNFSTFRPDQLGAPKKTGGAKGRSAAEPSTVEGWTKALQMLQKINDDMADEVRKFTENMDRVNRSVSDAIIDQAYAIKALEANTPDWLQRAEEFIRAKTDEGYIWDADTKRIYLNNAARLEQGRIIAQGATRARRATEVAGAGALGGALGRSEDEIHKQYEAHMDAMRDLASNLTNILDRAIYDGFQGGLKRGFASLTLGILDLVRNVFLKQLENALTNALAGAGGGGGGKRGFLSNVFGIVFGAVAGGIGGGFGGGGFTKGGASGGFAGKFASGGNIPMGQWGIVGTEKVLSTPFGAQVFPSSQGEGGQVVNNYTINVPVRGAGAYSSPKSRRQIGADVMAAIQGSMA